MKENLLALAQNTSLSKTTHWAVFGLGALSLTFAIAATAASAF